jgi:hypothetical protein
MDELPDDLRRARWLIRALFLVMAVAGVGLALSIFDR